MVNGKGTERYLKHRGGATPTTGSRRPSLSGTKGEQKKGKMFVEV